MERYLLIACLIVSAAAAVFSALAWLRASRERGDEEGLRAELARQTAMQEERERALRRELSEVTQRTVGSMGGNAAAKPAAHGRFPRAQPCRAAGKLEQERAGHA